MIYIIIFVLTLIFSCGNSGGYGNHSAEDDSDDANEIYENSCDGINVIYQRPQLPENPALNVPDFYNKNYECVPLPESENGMLVLGEGCFLGCIKVEKKLKISGNGAENTLIRCNDNGKEAVVEVSPYAELVLENISVSGNVRCILAAEGSKTFVEKSALSHCKKGGINICPDETGCRADLSVTDSFIGDIDEAESGISYGISFSNGTLNISGSEISGLNSFGVAVWGESGEYNEINIENSIITGVYGGLRSYEGHGFYAENSADITIKKSSVSDTAASFVFVSSESDEISLQLVDFNAKNMLETSEEQSGVVLDGKVEAYLKKVFIENSRGNGIFSHGALLYAEDLTIKSVFSDGICNNGFGLQLVDDSESFIRNFSLVSAEKAGVLLDGNCSADIEDFEILSTKSDGCSGEYGIGAAVQNGAVLSMKNGVVSDNRESGFLVLGSEISLENVEIKNTKLRECMKNGECVFAPDTEFAHGISLYSSSVLRFVSVNISENHNGLNIENSEILGYGEKEISLNGNITAVNAWNISDFTKLEENLANSRFCGNESVFTADLQPVRDDF